MIVPKKRAEYAFSGQGASEMSGYYGGWESDRFRQCEIGDWEALVNAQTPEGPTLQAKRDVQQDDIAHWVTAFANGEGGVLLIGVDTTRVEGKGDIITSVPGTKRYHLSMQKLQDIICSHVDPPPTSGNYHLSSAAVGDDGARAYAVFVPRSEGGPHQYDGKYLQPGPESATPMTDRQVRDAMGRGQKPEFGIAIEEAVPRGAHNDDAIAVRVKLTNTGRGTARQVIVILRVNERLGLNTHLLQMRHVSFAAAASHGSSDRILEWNVGSLPPGLARSGSFALRIPKDIGSYGSGYWLFEIYADDIKPQLVRVAAQINRSCLLVDGIRRVGEDDRTVEWTWGIE